MPSTPRIRPSLPPALRGWSRPRHPQHRSQDRRPATLDVDRLDPDEPEALDPDTWAMPRQLTRREGHLSAGPDWAWTRPVFEGDDSHD